MSSRNLKFWVLLKRGFSQKFPRNRYGIKLNSQYSTGVSAGVSSRKKFVVECGGNGAKMEFGVTKYTYETIYKNMTRDHNHVIMCIWYGQLPHIRTFQNSCQSSNG